MIEVENPLRAEESILRPALLPGPAARGRATTPRTASPTSRSSSSAPCSRRRAAGETLPVERLHARVRRARARSCRAPHEPDRAVDRATTRPRSLDALAQELRLADLHLVAAAPPRLPSRRAPRDVLVDGSAVGSVGEVDAEVVDALALAGPVVACEIDVDALLARRARRSPRLARCRASRRRRSTSRSSSPTTFRPATCMRTLREAGGELLETVALFDVFRSDALGAGKVSLAFALRFRALDRTLTDAEVGELRQTCIDAVVAAHGAELRS